MTHLLLLLTSGITIFAAAGLVLVPLLSEPSMETQRILQAAVRTNAILDLQPASSRAEDTLLKLSRWIQSLVGAKDNSSRQVQLQQAGIRNAAGPDIFFAVQFLAPLACAFAASFIHTNTLFCVMIFSVLGFLLPDLWLKRMTKKRQKKIQKGMPDALDLLVICVDAGLGLDQAMIRVTDELKPLHPAIYEEFLQVNLEQRAGSPRMEALHNLCTRTEVEEVKSFVGMIVQTDRFGTPILKALKEFAEDIRGKRQQRAEEAASKTKIKIVFPLVFCIFPCIFLVLLAPALLGIMEGLRDMGK